MTPLVHIVCLHLLRALLVTLTATSKLRAERHLLCRKIAPRWLLNFLSRVLLHRVQGNLYYRLNPLSLSSITSFGFSLVACNPTPSLCIEVAYFLQYDSFFCFFGGVVDSAAKTNKIASRVQEKGS